MPNVVILECLIIPWKSGQLERREMRKSDEVASWKRWEDNEVTRWESWSSGESGRWEIPDFIQG